MQTFQIFEPAKPISRAGGVPAGAPPSANPDLSAAAARGAAVAQVQEPDVAAKFRQEYDARLVNLSESLDKLRVRVSELEAKQLVKDSAPLVPPATPPAAQESVVAPTPPSAPVPPVSTPQPDPSPSAVAGNPVTTWADGPHKGKFWRVMKDEAKEAFKTRAGLSDADWDFWVKHQLPEDKKEHPENYKDASWN